jgi:hypothetical protein
MVTDRNNLYLMLSVACLAGYIWFFFTITADNKSVEVCIIKHLTNMPCPSCGSTRSVVELSKGNFVTALKLNPIGYVIVIIMFTLPIWIIIDVLTGSRSLLNFYLKSENHIRRPQYAIPLILLIIINWIWNVKKGL